MAWEIRKEIKKYLPNNKFKVRHKGNGWYDIIIYCPSKTIEDAKESLNIMDMLYNKMANFETENEIILSITI